MSDRYDLAPRAPKPKPLGAAAAATVRWVGATAIYGHHALGAWPKRKRAAATRAVTAVHNLDGSRLLAAGGDSGAVRLLRSPALVAGAPSVAAAAHGSAVACLRWAGSAAAHDDGDGSSGILLSCGGQDRTLLQWRAHSTRVRRLTPWQRARASKRWQSSISRVMLLGTATGERSGGSKMALCHLCGTLNAAPTRDRHLAKCVLAWHAAQEAAAKRDTGGASDDEDPGPLPADPHANVDFSALTVDDLEPINDLSEALYFSHFHRECPHCRRTFKKASFRRHRTSCTADDPFQRPLARRKPGDPRGIPAFRR